MFQQKSFEQFLRSEYAQMANNLPVGLYLTPRMAGSTTKGWNGVIFVHQGPYQDGVFKFRIDFPQLYQTPVVMFSALQVYNPYVNLESGKLSVELATRNANLWHPGGLQLLVQSVWNIFNDVAVLAPQNGVKLPNEEAVVLKQKALVEFFQTIKQHALSKQSTMTQPGSLIDIKLQSEMSSDEIVKADKLSLKIREMIGERQSIIGNQESQQIVSHLIEMINL